MPWPGIIQGGMYEDPAMSHQRPVEAGLMVGVNWSLSVGEPKEEMIKVLIIYPTKMPHDKPRYLMGGANQKTSWKRFAVWICSTA